LGNKLTAERRANMNMVLSGKDIKGIGAISAEERMAASKKG